MPTPRRSSSASTATPRSRAGSTGCRSRTRSPTPSPSSPGSARSRSPSPTPRPDACSARSARTGTTTGDVAEIGYWLRADARGQRRHDPSAPAHLCVGTRANRRRATAAASGHGERDRRAASPRRPASRSRACSGARTGIHASNDAWTGRCTRSCRASPRDPGHRRAQRRAAARVAEPGVVAGAQRRGSSRSAAHARGRDRRRVLRDLRPGGRLRQRPARGRRRDRRRVGGAVRRAADPRACGADRAGARGDRRARPDDRAHDRRPRAVPRGRRARRDHPSRGRRADRAGARQSRRLDRARTAVARDRLEPAERLRLRRALHLSGHAGQSDRG